MPEQNFTLTVTCLECGERQDVDSRTWLVGNPCPLCGGEIHEKLEAFFNEEIPAQIDSFYYRGEHVDGDKFLRGRVAYEITDRGPTAGTLSLVEQHVDERAKRYRKNVTLSDGTVVKDVDGDLRDQSLHGPQETGEPKEPVESP